MRSSALTESRKINDHALRGHPNVRVVAHCTPGVIHDSFAVRTRGLGFLGGM
jgi:hypothetical protein